MATKRMEAQASGYIDTLTFQPEISGVAELYPLPLFGSLLVTGRAGSCAAVTALTYFLRATVTVTVTVTARRRHPPLSLWLGVGHKAGESWLSV